MWIYHILSQWRTFSEGVAGDCYLKEASIHGTIEDRKTWVKSVASGKNTPGCTCFCGGVFVVVFLWWGAGVFVVVWLLWVLGNRKSKKYSRSAGSALPKFNSSIFQNKNLLVLKSETPGLPQLSFAARVNDRLGQCLANHHRRMKHGNTLASHMGAFDAFNFFT